MIKRSLAVPIFIFLDLQVLLVSKLGCSFTFQRIIDVVDFFCLKILVRIN